MLEPGRSSALSWSRGGQQAGSISLVAQHDGVRLVYSAKDRDGAAVNVSELVPFVYTPTRFGGRRQWLRCLKCGRGCRKVYGGQLLPMPTVPRFGLCIAERASGAARD